MSYTSFGEFMRILRIQNHEVMGDVAKMLGVAVPFLSAVENGKKNVPAEWIEKIVQHYNLNQEKREEMMNAIEESKTQYKIVVGDASISQRQAALQFARSFKTMDEKTAKKILDLLEEEDE